MTEREREKREGTLKGISQYERLYKVMRKRTKGIEMKIMVF